MSEYRVYLENGAVAHLLRPGHSPNGTCSESLCGLTSWPTMWRGTGNMEERQKADELRPCTPCAAADKRERERQTRKREAQINAAGVGWRGTHETLNQASETRGA